MSGAQQRSSAAEMLQFLQSLPLLTPSDKRGVLQLIQSCLRAAEFEFDLVAATNGDVSIWRQQESRKGIYRVSGMGSVNADPKVGGHHTACLDLQTTLLRTHCNC